MNLNREIIRLTIPSILTNITVPVLGLCDTGIAGHLGDGRFIGAISVGSMMLNVIFWLCGFLRMGTTGLTAQAFGAKDSVASRCVFTRAFILASLLGIVILACSGIICAGLLLLVGAEDAIHDLARTYFRICIFGAPAQLATMAVAGWLLGMQNTTLPMTVSITTNIVNVALSFILVFYLHAGFAGVALGTLIANWCGLILALILAHRFARKSPVKRLRATLAELRNPHAASLRRFFTVNTDIFFRSACVMAVSLTVTSVGARLGWLTLSTNALMMQFFILFSYFMDGFAFTAEALSGRFEGEGNLKMLKKSIKYLLVWSACVAVCFTICYLAGWQQIIGLLTDSAEIRANVGQYHLYLIVLPLVTVAAFIFDGFFIGLTATRAMLIVTLISAAVFTAVAFLHTGRWALPDNHFLWTAFLSYLFCRGALLAAKLPSLLRKRETRPSPL